MEEQYGGALKIGGAVGAAAILVSLVLTLISQVPLCGCISGPLNFLLPLAVGLGAGAAAAFRADWDVVEEEQRTMFGIHMGVRAGLVASVIASVAAYIIGLIFQVLWMGVSVLLSGGDMEAAMAAIMVSLFGMVLSVVIGLVVAVVTSIGGAVLGIIGGVGVAATR